MGCEKNKEDGQTSNLFKSFNIYRCRKNKNSKLESLKFTSNSSSTYNSDGEGLSIRKTEKTKKRAIAYGIIWSLSYWIVGLTSGLWWHNYILFNVYRFMAPIIWFPYTIWAWFFASVTTWSPDNLILIWYATVPAVPTSILIVYIVSRLREVIK